MSVTKEQIEQVLWDVYRSGGNFSKQNLKSLGLPSYNTLMRRGVCFKTLKESFARRLYETSYKKCGICETKIPYESRANTFCSRRCSAINSNRVRPPNSRRGPPKGSQPKYKNREPRPPYTRIGYCGVCGKPFHRKNARKTCSKLCWDSIVKYNRGRHKRSYMEESFSRWLDNQEIKYLTEVQFKNTELNKCYYVDFLFEDRKLIIELDGSQHEKTKELDRIRDLYLNSQGYKVLRVSHKEYQAGSRLSEIESLLKD